MMIDCMYRSQAATQAGDTFTFQTSIDLEVDMDDVDDDDNDIPPPLLPAVNKTENIAGNMQIV